MLKIDDNVPIPTLKNRNRYPFALLEVGQSFFMTGVTTSQMCNCFGYHTKRTGRRFSARATVENGVAGVRVWRVS